MGIAVINKGQITMGASCLPAALFAKYYSGSAAPVKKEKRLFTIGKVFGDCFNKSI
jgi:hypothetical protein